MVHSHCLPVFALDVILGLKSGVFRLHWLDEQKRVFGFIHWVDFLLLLACILVIGKAVWSFWPTRPIEKKSVVYMTIEAPNIHPKVTESIPVGSWVKDSRSGILLGSVVKKKTAPRYILRWESGKEFKQRAFPERMDMTLTLKLSVQFKEDEGYFIGPLSVRAGRKGNFYTMLSEFKGEVVQVVKSQTDPAE